MSPSPDREQHKRECADALEALHRERRVDGLHLLADAIRTLRSSVIRIATFSMGPLHL